MHIHYCLYDHLVRAHSEGECAEKTLLPTHNVNAGGVLQTPNHRSQFTIVLHPMITNQPGIQYSH